MADFFLTWADPSAAAHYREAELCSADRTRAHRPRGPRAALDWQVSRALLHAVRENPAPHTLSLSHSHGHAVCARAPTGWRIGVDLERCQPRDFLRLADWVCSHAEQQHLARLSGGAQQQYFYQLWTLKEAFIKAAGLSFPADMARMGLQPEADGRQTLLAPPGRWQACSWQAGEDWLAACVWQTPALTPETVPAAPAALPAASPTASPSWRTLAGSKLPRLKPLGAWQAWA